MGDEITIGPVRDADTGEIETPASETGSGDGSNELGAENFDDDNISSFDPENNTQEDEDDFSDVDTGGDDSDGGDSDTTAVVVTENQQGEQVTVGQGTDTQEARVDAALNPDFDAAPGEEVDAFETAADTGLGDGTGPDALINDRQKETRQQDRQRDEQNIFEENIEDAQLIQAQLTDKQREFAQARNPNTPIVENVGDIVRTIGQEGQDVIEGNNPQQSFKDIEDSFLIEGQGIISQGQQFGNQISSDLKQGDVELRLAGQPVENVGRVLDFAGVDTVGNQLQDTGEKIDRSLVGGLATGGTAAGGLALQAPGASPKILRGTLQDASRQDVDSFLKIGSGRIAQGSAEIALSSNTPESQQNNAFEQFDGKDELNLVEAGAGGVRLTANQAKDDPVKFIFSEAGEEAIETVGGFAAGGFAGAAAAAAPTPTPEVSLTSTVKNKAASAKQAVTDPNAAGSLAGAFVPDETTPGSDPRPGNNQRPGTSNTVILQDTTGFDLQTEKTTQSKPEAQTQATQQDTTGFDIQTRPVTDFTDQTASEPASQPNTNPITEPQTEPQIQIESRPETRTEATPRVETRPEVIAEPIVETRPEPEIVPEVRPETRIEPSPRPRPRGVDQRSEQVLGFVEPPATVEQAADTPSIDAILLGIEKDSENNDEEPSVFTGFETRPLEDDSDVFDIL